MATPKPEMVILYASVTGVSEDVAYRVHREADRLNISPSIESMDLYDFRNIDEETRPICFICSTTGQGEEPATMKEFWNFLRRKSLPRNMLSKLRFGVIGLGDSSYAKFNVVAKKLHKRLMQLGALAILDVALGDDQHELGPDAVIDPWLGRFWTQLQLWLAPDRPLTTGVSEAYQAKSRFYIEQERNGNSTFQFEPYPRPPAHLVKKCPLLKNERVTAEDHFQDVRLFSIDLTGTSLTYEPGDVLVVHPSNSKENIDLFFEIFPQFEEYRNTKYFISECSEACGSARYKPVVPQEMIQICPQPWTLDYIVKNYFDLQGVPKRYFFELLSYFTSDELEKEKFREYSSTEGQQEMYNYCIRPKRNVLEVFQDFPHTTKGIPLGFLFDLIGPIKPRSFSIASSITAHKNVVQVLVAVVNYKTILKAPRIGLCSNWMAGLEAGDVVPIGIQKGSFHFPIDSEKPIVMIGPGTGVAPFRSFISANHDTMDLTLFFGCRYERKDFYFQDQWAELKQKNELEVFTAFSRDNPSGSRTYVQHKIAEQASLIYDRIYNRGGAIFLAGNAKRMPTDVYEALTKVFKDSKIPYPDVYMEHLVKSGRYQTEVWS